MESGASANGPLVKEIAAEIEREMEQWRQQGRALTSKRCIYPFPADFLSGIEEGIQSPRLASFGPYYKGKDNLLAFNEHKADFRNKFLERIEGGRGSLNVVAQLSLLECTVRDCYDEYKDAGSITSKDFVSMMLLDGSFIVELFCQCQYQNGLDTQLPWYKDLSTLTADLLKIGNQLPFFLLETLYFLSRQTGDQVAASTAQTRVGLKTMALSFFNQALGRPSDMIFQDMQQPKHLLDLFRSSILPATAPRNICKALPGSIQGAELLSNAGITLRRKRANSLLEIDFRKLRIPPFTLRIPPVAIDDLTSTILVHCFAWEQCSHNTSKHFTDYISFMNCLVREPEDVRVLRTANIITSIRPHDNQYVINLLESFREKVHFNVRDSYLWNQYREIDSYYDSLGAYIWRNFARYNSVTVLVSILAALIALCSWLFTWLLPKESQSSS